MQSVRDMQIDNFTDNTNDSCLEIITASDNYKLKTPSDYSKGKIDKEKIVFLAETIRKLLFEKAVGSLLGKLKLAERYSILSKSCHTLENCM